MAVNATALIAACLLLVSCAAPQKKRHHKKHSHVSNQSSKSLTRINSITTEPLDIQETLSPPTPVTIYAPPRPVYPSPDPTPSNLNPPVKQKTEEQKFIDGELQ